MFEPSDYWSDLTFERSLRVKDTKVMKAPAFDKGFKVIESVILLNLLPALREGTFFSSFLGCRCHVIETCEETARLSCDDGNRKSPSEMMEDETLLRIRHWAAFKKGDVIGFGGG